MFDFFAKLNKRPIVDVSWHDYGAKDHGKAGIAQLVEHLICNQGVPGSNPGAGTIIIKDGLVRGNLIEATTMSG